MSKKQWKTHGETGGEPGVMAGNWEAVHHVTEGDEPVLWSLFVGNDDTIYFGFRSEADRELIQNAAQNAECAKVLRKIMACWGLDGNKKENLLDGARFYRALQAARKVLET
jgi:hypothetical protein